MQAGSVRGGGSATASRAPGAAIRRLLGALALVAALAALLVGVPPAATAQSDGTATTVGRPGPTTDQAGEEGGSGDGAGGDDGATSTDGSGVDEPDADEGGPEVELSFPAGDLARIGGSVPVRVEVTAADGLVRGSVAVASEPVDEDIAAQLRRGMPQGLITELVATEPAIVELPVEVAAGATWEGVVVLPVLATSFSGWFGPGGGISVEVDAELVVDGEVVADDDQRLGLGGDGRVLPEVVGLLPATAARTSHPEDLDMLEGPQTAEVRFVALDPQVLGAGPGALDPFAQVVGTAGDVAALGDVARTTLDAWLLTGGHLLVEGGADGLPADLAPTDVAWRRVGAGDVRVVDDLLAEGSWEVVARPTSAGDPRRATGLVGAGLYTEGLPAAPASAVLGRDAGFRLPDVDPLLVLLVVYALVAGPVAFTVLRRRGRTTRAWVVLPAVAGVAALLFAVVGVGLRPTAEATHATVVEVTPDGAWASTTVLVGSVPGGTTSVAMPAGWHPAMPGGSEGGRPVVVGADGAAAELALAAGAKDVVRATGPTTLPGTLEVAAELAGPDDAVEVAVTNGLDVALEDVVVLVGLQATPVDDLAPGQATTLAVEDDPLAVDRAIRDGRSDQVELGLWPALETDLTAQVATACSQQWCQDAIVCDEQGCRPAVGLDDVDPDDSAVSSVAWVDFLRHDDLAARGPDVVTVVGWTRDLPAPVTLGGGSIDTGRTAVVARTALDAPGELEVGLRRERLHDVRTTQFGFGQQIGDIPVHSRLVLPTTVDGAPTDPGALSLTVPGAVVEVAFWTGDGWRPYTRVPFSLDPITVPVPPEAVVAGVVHVRTFGDLWDVALGGEAEQQHRWQLAVIDDEERAALEAERAAAAEVRRDWLASRPDPEPRPEPQPQPGDVVFGAVGTVAGTDGRSSGVVVEAAPSTTTTVEDGS